MMKEELKMLRERLEKFFEELKQLPFPEDEIARNGKHPLYILSVPGYSRVADRTIIVWMLKVANGEQIDQSVRLDGYNLQLFWDTFRGHFYMFILGHDSWPKTEMMINDLIKKHNFQR